MNVENGHVVASAKAPARHVTPSVAYSLLDQQAAVALAVEALAGGGTIRQVAAELGLDCGTLSRWKRKLRPDLNTAPRIGHNAVPPGHGLDLSKKALDVRRIVLKHFSVPGVHPDDLVQEVYAEILRLNASERSAYDPARASLGKYVYLVGRSVTIKLAGREQRQVRIRDEYRRAYRSEPEYTGMEAP